MTSRVEKALSGTNGQATGAVASLVVIGLVLAVAPLPAAATPARVEIVKSISTPNPFPNACGGDPPALTDNEFEPTITIDPRNPDRLVVAWMQDQRFGGAAVDVAGSRSSDGGRTWHNFTFPKTTRCTGAPDWNRGGDPWLSTGPDGTTYFTSLSEQTGELPVDPTMSFLLNTRVLVHRSRDGGRTWADPVKVPQPLVDRDDRYPDRPVLTADPRTPGHAYIVWTVTDDPSPRGSYFARTTDGGVTWSPPKLVLSAPDAAHFATELFVLPSGALVAVFGKVRFSGLANPAQGNPVLVIRSTDKGDTWSQPVQAARDYPSAARDRDTGSEKNDAGEQPIGALGPDGTIYVLVQDNRSQSDSGILMVHSSDEGRTWSEPRQVVGCKCQAFKPIPAVMSDGTLGLVYHDDRNDRSGDSQWTTDVWFAHSHDRGARWSETHLAGPYDYRQPQGAESTAARHGYSAGDYQEMVALPNGFGAAFFMGRGQAKQGPSDIFFGRVALASDSRSCLARRSPIGSRNIGRIRLGYTRRRLLRLPVMPARRSRRAFRYCVKRSRGRVTAVFSNRSGRGQVRLVTTTARGHGNRRVRVRSGAATFRRAYPNRRRVARGLYRAGRRSSRLFGLRRGRVRFIAVADRRLLHNRRVLRRSLRLAGL